MDTATPAAQQPIDSAYTAKIKEHLQDARITTELVDHLPASSTVPTPLKFHGRIVGTPGELKAQFGVPTIDDVFVRLARPAAATV